MPAAYTHKPSVQVSDFEDIGLLIQLARLVCDFCSSSQRFACGFLQIPPRDGHPCRPANDSPCRARRRLSLPSKSALPGAHHDKAEQKRGFLKTSKNLIENQTPILHNKLDTLTARLVTMFLQSLKLPEIHVLFRPPTIISQEDRQCL
jgi:hypothetical protein